MKPHSNSAHHHRIALGDGLSLPEYRHIDLYDKKKKLVFLEDSTAENSALSSLLNAVRMIQVALDDHLSAQDPLLGEGVPSWQRYLCLPRTSQTDKLIAEVFRILRIVRICVTHAQGHLEVRDGLIRTSCNFGGCMLSLNITSAGLGLLGSFVVYYLESFAQPHSDAYVEWMLSQYFTDLVDEIRKFSDEDRVLFQFQRKAFFNRHFRFDCDHPRVNQSDDHYTFEIGKFHADRAVYPIDLYAVLDDCLHIVPVEALKDGRLACEQLPRWKARCPDNESLPAKYRHRFVRDRMVVGLPMT